MPTPADLRRRVTVTRLPLVVALLLVALPLAAAAEQWLHYGGDAGGQKFTPHTQITPANVSSLAVAWTYRTGDADRYPASVLKSTKFELTPILLPQSAGGHLM